MVHACLTRPCDLLCYKGVDKFLNNTWVRKAFNPYDFLKEIENIFYQKCLGFMTFNSKAVEILNFYLILNVNNIICTL